MTKEESFEIGGTIKEMAGRCNINPNTYYYWMKVNKLVNVNNMKKEIAYTDSWWKGGTISEMASRVNVTYVGFWKWLKAKNLNNIAEPVTDHSCNFSKNTYTPTVKEFESKLLYYDTIKPLTSNDVMALMRAIHTERRLSWLTQGRKENVEN